MKKIVEIRETAFQNMVIIGEEGEEINFTLKFSPTQQAWFFDLIYKDITINGKQLSNFPNVLRSYKNVFSFGFWCSVVDGEEPFKIDDFTSGMVSLYLLNSSEVSQVEQDIFGEIS